MVSKKEGKIVLWLSYFDINNPRPVRKLSKKLALDKPTPEKIVQCAKELGLNPVVEEARYPRYWWNKSYRILVDKKYKKSEIIKKIGDKLHYK